MAVVRQAVDAVAASSPRVGLTSEFVGPSPSSPPEFSEGVSAPEASASCDGGATLDQIDFLGLVV